MKCNQNFLLWRKLLTSLPPKCRLMMRKRKRDLNQGLHSIEENLALNQFNTNHIDNHSNTPDHFLLSHPTLHLHHSHYNTLDLLLNDTSPQCKHRKINTKFPIHIRPTKSMIGGCRCLQCQDNCSPERILSIGSEAGQQNVYHTTKSS